MLGQCGEEAVTMEAPSGMVSAEKYEELVVKYNDICKRYRDLKRDHAKCEGWMAQFYEKYKGMKDCVKGWQAYYDKHQKAPMTNEAASSPAPDAVEKRHSTRVTSSQTTEDDQASSPPKAHGLASDEEPEIVSTRSLKRKRSPPARKSEARVYIKQEEANSPENPINLMSEDYSSPVAKRQKPMRAETSDLDAYVSHMETPRRRRRQRGTFEEVTRPAPLSVSVSSLSDGGLPVVLGGVTNAGVEAGLTAGHSDPSVTARDFANSSVESGNSNALRPRSVNIPTASSATIIRHVANAKRKREERPPISILSEDGEDHNGQLTMSRPHVTPGVNVKRRLKALLEEPTPERQPLSAQCPPAARTPRLREPQTSPKQRKAKATSPVEVPYQYKTPLGLEPPPPHASPDDEPLRQRPWQTLQLEDFRINPKFMGTNYAFSETFRGREQRRCLPGCNKPDCCGNAFRKAIEIGSVQTNKTDAEVLEAYLGRNYSQVMAAYSPGKRKDLLIQAHACAFANQHGKHRQAYERPRSPPGFWRTDMPTTQEAEEDRAKAHEMEREKVEERWREAMRDGGRWLFRDE